MNTETYRYFIEVAKWKSFTKAARALYMTPQGLQSALKRFEAKFNVPLFNVSGVSVDLTDFGAIVYDHARQITDEENRMNTELEQTRRQKESRILLSSSLGLFNIITRTQIYNFNDAAQTNARVEIAGSLVDHECENNLYERHCDFALLIDPVDHTYFASIPLHRDTMFLWIPKDHPLALKPSLSSADFKGERIAQLTSNDYKTSELNRQTILNETDCEIVNVDEMIEMLEMALRHEALALTVRTHAHAFKNEGFIAVPVDDLRWGFSVAYRNDRILTPQDEEFLNYLQKFKQFYI